MNFMKICLLMLSYFLIESKLLQVVSLFRHGARYHLNDLYDGKQTRQLWGQLTSVGMRQHQNLGKMLRKDYIQDRDFLSKQYNSQEIQVYSTNVNRTIESVRCQMYGLYPLGTGFDMPQVDTQYHIPPFSNKTDSIQQQKSLPEGHQPIPVNITSQVLGRPCPNFDRITQNYINFQSATYKEMNLTYYPFFVKMSDMFKINIKDFNFSKASSLFDTLVVDQYLARPWPQDFREQDFENLKHLHQWWAEFRVPSNLSNAYNSQKISKVLRDFDSRISNSNQKLKWTFLSAHDSDVAPMLLDLNITSAQCIQEKYRRGQTSDLNCESSFDFASSIIFELHTDNDKDFYVRIRHNGKYVYLCERKNTSCDYVQWRARAKKIVDVNYNQICGVSLQEDDSNGLQSRYELTVSTK